jgi:CRP-like cAMP-binding protein
MLTSSNSDLPSSLSPVGEAAWAESFFGRLPARAQAVLRDSAVELQVDPGHVVHRELLTAPMPLVLVASGLVRVYVSSPLGRGVTIRYARHGVVTGLPGAIAGGTRHGVEAVTRCNLVMVPAAVLRHLARTDVEVAWTVCNVLKDLVMEITDHLSSSVFRSVTERVAFALVELTHEEDGVWVVDASQQQLADSIGSVREVVARSLRQLRAANLIASNKSRIVLRDVPALQRLVGYGAAGGLPLAAPPPAAAP